MASQIEDQIRQTAISYGIDPAIALAVAKQESGFNQGARGAAGEVGIFQLMPATAAGLNVNPYNQTANIQGGVSYLAQLYRQFGDWTKALAAYNGGPTAMAQGKTPTVSWMYADNVLATSTLFGGSEPSPDASGDLGYTEASLWPEIPNWAWLVGLAGVGLLMMLRRD